MSGFLLDTNVLSELRKQSRADANVLVWFESVKAESLHVSVMVLGEIRDGIERVRRRDRIQALALERWMKGLEETYSDRLLPVTGEIADRWGRLQSVRPIPAVDALFAATALVHDLTFVTRDTADIRGTGVTILNPFAPA